MNSFTTMKKIGFFGGKHMGFHCLNHMIKEKIIPEFVLVNPDDDGKPGPFYESTKKVSQDNDLNLLDDIEDVLTYQVDIVLSIGYAQIIKKNILNHPRLGIINAHPAPLPKYRGRFSTMFAIINDEKTHGVTFHFMDERIDSGDILLQKMFPIKENDTGKSLYMKASELIVEEFSKLLKMCYEDNLPKRTPQNEHDSSYYRKEIPNAGIVELDWDGKKLNNYVRALYFPPFEPAKIKIGNKYYYITPTN